MRGATYGSALERLKTTLARKRSDGELQEIIKARDEVLGRYGQIFHPAHLAQLEEVDFRSFLYPENNRHWSGLYRHASSLTSDMEALKSALASLLDEDRLLSERFDLALGSIRGFGKALATAILLVVYPERYGVWNNTSEAGLKSLDLWPEFERGATMGQQYERINAVLNDLARDLGTDLWTIDALWWGLARDGEEEGHEPFADELEDRLRFGLERHLHDFLRDNWELTDLGKEWVIYKEPGEDDAGYEFPTDVGRIDILAQHKTRPEWLVIELKRDRGADRAVGQLLRYMGWVSRHMAAPGELVRGMIVSRSIDKDILYAIEAVGGDRIQVMQYEVNFNLNPVELGQEAGI